MHPSIVEQIALLGTELNTNQYKLVRLAAEYDNGLEWFDQGFKSPAMVIARTLDIHTSTACEWIRVGHALDCLPLIDRAFRANNLSYAKTRILTRWADPENEQDLISLASERTANRLTTAVANYMAGNESDVERDERHHDHRGVTIRTDADGMVTIRAVLPPSIGKQVAEAVDAIVRQVAAIPHEGPADTKDALASTADGRGEASAGVPTPHNVTHSTGSTAVSDRAPSADASPGMSMTEQLRELKQQWQPAGQDEWCFPSAAQQRADAFVLLFLFTNIDLTTEVVIHVRGDGTTFDDGTPVTDSAVCQRLDESFVRLMIHDCEGHPIDASNRRRFPTTRQKRVVSETHNHECVDCQSPDLLEFDHNPPFRQTGHSVTTELETRCAPCHRARHRLERI